MFKYSVTVFLIFSALLSAKEPLLKMTDKALATFKKDVKPLINKYCVECHGPKKQKAKLRLDTLSPDLFNPRNAETWHDVLDSLNKGEMPEEDADQPTIKELDVMTKWLTKELKIAIGKQKQAGGNVVRRLTKYEYQNTMEVLLGLKMDYSSDLPPDSATSEGFKNNGSTLQMSPIQLEYYFSNARKALSRILIDGPKPKELKVTTTKPNPKNQKGFSLAKSNTITQGQGFGVFLEKYPQTGPFKLTVKLEVENNTGKANPRLRIQMGHRMDTLNSVKPVCEDFDVTKSGTYTFYGLMEEFPIQKEGAKFPGMLISLINGYDDGKLAQAFKSKGKQPKKTKKPKKGEKPKKGQKTKPTPIPVSPFANTPKIIIKSVEYVGNYYESWPSQNYQKIFIQPEKRKSLGEAKYAQLVLKNFMSRAYRRPVKDTEISWVMSYYNKLRPNAASFNETMKDVLALVLASPEFIYRMEPVDPAKRGQKNPLTDHELATRLSYFLWSTMPDNRLTDLANKGLLRDKKVLQSELKRMIKDERINNFVHNFSSQWLDLDGVNRVAIDPQVYPGFNDSLKVDMQEETRQYFAEVFKKNLSALNFLDSDFVVVNNRLSKHYGLVNGNPSGEFKAVKLPKDSPRGGLLTQGSMFLATSTGVDSHPIKRAVWLLERILHDPPSPPPPDVEFNADDPSFKGKTLKEQLEMHRDVPACIRCHLRIDPWGIAFEEFDAIGLHKAKAKTVVNTNTSKNKSKKKKPSPKVNLVKFDASTELPTGQKINNLQDLKSYLLKSEKDKFAKAMVHKLLSYSLGRTLDITDEDTVKALSQNFKQQDYKMQSLIEIIILSDAFLSK